MSMPAATRQLQPQRPAILALVAKSSATDERPTAKGGALCFSRLVKTKSISPLLLFPSSPQEGRQRQ